MLGGNKYIYWLVIIDWKIFKEETAIDFISRLKLKQRPNEASIFDLKFLEGNLIYILLNIWRIITFIKRELYLMTNVRKRDILLLIGSCFMVRNINRLNFYLDTILSLPENSFFKMCTTKITLQFLVLFQKTQNYWIWETRWSSFRRSLSWENEYEKAEVTLQIFS